MLSHISFAQLVLAVQSMAIAGCLALAFVAARRRR